MKSIRRTILLLFAASLPLSSLAVLGEADMPVVVDRPLTEAERSQTLAHAQEILIDLGYLTGRADGIAGPRTAEALKSFQRQRGMEVTGELDAPTMNALEQMQSTLEEAVRLQQRLIDLGYMRGRADGIFGERSQAALRLFQAMQGLEATGKLDDETGERLFANGAAALPQYLSEGDRGDGVEALQKRLIQFGFLSGSADGVYGKKTTAAVRRLQKHLIAQGVDENLGIEASGEATPATQALLTDAGYTSYLCDLDAGYEGEEAARVERRLAQLGYMDAEPDEVFDDYALSAARAFEADAGLPQGPLDRAAIDALFSEDAPVAEHFVLHDIAYGDRGVAVREAEEAMLYSGMLARMPRGWFNDSLVEAVGRVNAYLVSVKSPAASLFEDTTRLSVGAQRLLLDGLLEGAVSGPGMDEEAIRRIQCRLHTLFYISRRGVDGKLGNGTLDAIREFQQTNGLPVTGNADDATQRALFSRSALAKPYPYRVEVDIDSQRVYVYERNDSGGYDQTQTFICSTGLGDTTPRGIFLNGFPVNRWHFFKDFHCWAQYSYEVEGNIMFHSVIYSDRDVGTLRQGSLYALGSKASHGCIRLQVEDAKWLYEHCKRGTLAIVIY